MNRREIKKAVSGYPDMKPVITDPTRGRHVLDIIMTNMTDLLKLAGVTDPICNGEGVRSDHIVGFLSLIHI